MWVTETGFEAISKLKNLKYFQLGTDYDEETLYEAKQVFELLSNGKLKNMETLKIYGISDYIVPLLMCTLVACPNLKFLDCECFEDRREEIPQKIIKVLFDNLPELRELKMKWMCGEISIFEKMDLQEIIEKCKNKLEVDLHESDYENWIKITREM